MAARGWELAGPPYCSGLLSAVAGQSRGRRREQGLCVLKGLVTQVQMPELSGMPLAAGLPSPTSALPLQSLGAGTAEGREQGAGRPWGRHWLSQGKCGLAEALDCFCSFAAQVLSDHKTEHKVFLSRAGKHCSGGREEMGGHLALPLNPSL